LESSAITLEPKEENVLKERATPQFMADKIIHEVINIMRIRSQVIIDK